VSPCGTIQCMDRPFHGLTVALLLLSLLSFQALADTLTGKKEPCAELRGTSDNWAR